MFPLRDSKSSGIFPFWTIAIIVINVYIFILELTSGNPDFFIRRYALIPSRVDFANIETLFPFVTSQFIHAGFLHIGSNMLFLWVFGDNVEGKLGHFLFPFFYLLAGAVGALAQYMIVPNSSIPMLGASGAIAGVLGAYYVLFPRHSVRALVLILFFPAIIDVPASLMLVYWFFTQVFNSVATITAGAQLGGVAWFAHVGGFVTGLVVGNILKR
ncbi:MAG: hypothetical protein A3D24_03615 [Candidatus Blackburnbacteria bacterium RIFCSPHIGHO2_02_FULL_39_13]|uniref:Peptidase S54 rhomboid domain-containing protein n=1 Tax=Candidatus Blackburnbacteria bacterium RIFCSPLOWO2_01_FULL_40_20 TaxID=1797519 RepID=A0A1G1VEY2_9BACT|nr:MAG: Rhomboid family protein [Microgenomates group bacterium GW2011_GWA2_39_19]OGY07160.1 MAG: hypothetical protein A2694_01215 [Candidatus Blackburnbacteria bacterium RIFCSPHIGHO2_01_FULL_40_17]OGY09990.1 MAG: hypothetical protein A3D24_03615 [Candidatus Blackburnbacteria bacterium RIFCSPHIGHO2_02_FULL_39_13]OGY13836.1 MAG: hypothetical protein A3A77_03605 [Candidatus Blackburnbacteria bacterium RIFCSPLOWO2_01_FULL_40_20]HBL52031.1 rhomboid family intramembrane serine protease [Candidatus B